ncbi:MAG: hypothetical protein Q7N50_01845, partial [Armatimonadota bacterium]|nr:hypothetical protein [Armatimonadota bacterium]
MSYWSVLIPEATTNDISNPSFEVGATTGWTAFGTDTLAVSTTYQYYGRYSGKLTSASEYVFVDEFDGVSDFNCIKFASANGAESVATGTAYTLSVMLYGDATIVGKTARIRLNEVGGAVDEAILGGTATKSATVVAGWQSLTTAVGTITQADRTSIRAVLGIDSAEISDVSYWDGAQVEKKAYGTTYCDGDQAGCSWNGTALASTSTRTSQSRSGGRWKDLYDDYGFGVISMIGFGMPELRHNTTPYSILPGSYLQSIKTKERQFALIMESQGGSLTSLHTKRDYLIDAFKPDLVYPLQPVKLKYSGATTELVISAHYLEGLEGMFDGEEGVNERI